MKRPATPATSATPRHGNFDAIRLIAATVVIFGHSFIVAIAADPPDRLYESAGALSICAVETFFVVSGYLVTRSFEQSLSWRHFVVARALRIFPGLTGCILFSAFVLGPALTTLPLKDYFLDGGVARFTIYNAFLDVFSFPFLPGVAFHALKGGAIINGSLWSLAFEFTCYSVVLALGVLGRLNSRTTTVLLALTLFSLSFRVLDGYAWFLSYFAAGMLMYFLRKRHRFSGRLASLAAAIVVVGNDTALPWAFFPVLGAYVVIYVAVDAPFQIANATRFGDLSYGIYLYGWPAEELAVNLHGGRTAWWQIFLMATPMAAMLAFCSWHLVEGPALRLKRAASDLRWHRACRTGSVAYAATAVLFGIGKIFAIGGLLPAALALGGGEAFDCVQARWLERSPLSPAADAKAARRGP